METKTTLITGSESGIGKETAFKFAKAGFNVVITYFKEKASAVEVSAKCLALGAPEVFVVKLDVTNVASIKKAVEKIALKFKKIDILINNAGTIVKKYLAEESYEEIEDQIRINLEGTIKVTRECLPYIQEAIVNIGSSGGLRPKEEQAVYCATKFGVRGFTQALALELIDLRVLVVNPGITATQMTNFKGDPPEAVAEIIFKAAAGKIKKESGADVNVWDYLK